MLVEYDRIYYMVIDKSIIPMIKNGKENKLSGMYEKIITSLLSVATAGVIGCFAFLWNLNSSVSRLQDHDTDNIKAREEWATKTNAIQLNIQDIRERLIRIETKTQRQ